MGGWSETTNLSLSIRRAHHFLGPLGSRLVSHPVQLFPPFLGVLQTRLWCISTGLTSEMSYKRIRHELGLTPLNSSAYILRLPKSTSRTPVNACFRCSDVGSEGFASS